MLHIYKNNKCNKYESKRADRLAEIQFRTPQIRGALQRLSLVSSYHVQNQTVGFFGVRVCIGLLSLCVSVHVYVNEETPIENEYHGTVVVRADPGTRKKKQC